MTPFLETDRLLLVRSREDHWPFLLELLNTPKWIENIGDRNVHTEEEARNYLKDKIIPNAHEEKGYGQLCMVRKTDKVIVGVTGIYKREGLEHADIGFALLPEYENQGYAYEGSMVLLDHVKSLNIVNRIEGITISSNVASQKLLEKLGLKFEKMTSLPDDSVEFMLYGIEW
jgi:RimJ/RimL family protein N-acetyltransferase